MKSFSKISSLIIAAALLAAVSSRAGDVVIKPLRYQPPTKSQFVEKVAVKPAITCAACKEEFVPTLTQDSKLKAKTVLVASHACNQCSTSVVRTGAQKATGKDVTQHKCGTLVAAVETCCGGMK